MLPSYSLVSYVLRSSGSLRAQWSIVNAGTQISVYGIIRINTNSFPPASTYQVDGGTPVSFTPPNTFSELDRALFFQSPILPVGSHIIVINVTRASQDAAFYLDYFTYNPGHPFSSVDSSMPTPVANQPAFASPEESSAIKTPTASSLLTGVLCRYLGLRRPLILIPTASSPSHFLSVTIGDHLGYFHMPQVLYWGHCWRGNRRDRFLCSHVPWVCLVV